MLLLNIATSVLSVIMASIVVFGWANKRSPENLFGTNVIRVFLLVVLITEAVRVWL